MAMPPPPGFPGFRPPPPQFGGDFPPGMAPPPHGKPPPMPGPMPQGMRLPPGLTPQFGMQQHQHHGPPPPFHPPPQHLPQPQYQPPPQQQQPSQQQQQQQQQSSMLDQQQNRRPAGRGSVPSVLDRVFQLKKDRALELGVKEDSDFTSTNGSQSPSTQDEGIDGDEADDEGGDKKSASAKEKARRKRKNKKKKSKQQQHQEQNQQDGVDAKREQDSGLEEEGIEVEYVEEKLKLDTKDPNSAHFLSVFGKFSIENDKPEGEEETKETEEAASKANFKAPKLAEEQEEEKKDETKVSRRKMKKLNRMTVADLKQSVTRPDVVEMHDVTSSDPKLLVWLKSTRNTVPVPRHWCFKRKYLQGKRGFEKPPFNLPEFIKRTGIMEMRQAVAEKEDTKTLKSKMREKVRPKMGKIEIDYQKLHDAFFRHQTKPQMTMHGELYYEGKELETKLKDKKPGELTDDLRIALGMPIGPNALKYPPPWLIAMQRYGPPPSYPNLKIPGLNGPIPEGCTFGYHAGGWGKPPVDETGRPLYGDVFGTMGANVPVLSEADVEKDPWGELEAEEEPEYEEEAEPEGAAGEEGAEVDPAGTDTPAEGLITPSGGASSVPAGLETPDSIELRKRKIEYEMESGDSTPQLYTILPEKKVDKVANAVMGSTHVYEIPGAGGKSRKGTEGVAIALDPLDLEQGLDEKTMQARLEQRMREESNISKPEDFSDMVAEHTARQSHKRKMKEKESASDASKKKKGQFKF